ESAASVMTVPTCARAHVERFASSSAIRMYTSYSGIRSTGGAPVPSMPRSTRLRFSGWSFSSTVSRGSRVTGVARSAARREALHGFPQRILRISVRDPDEVVVPEGAAGDEGDSCLGEQPIAQGHAVLAMPG